MKDFSIGITGVGMVGGALKEYFQKKGITPLLYDKPKNIGSLKEVNRADIVFVCVPTPFNNDKGFDLQYVEDTMQALEGKKIVVIKSTVLPGTTEELQKTYTQHQLLFNPEFLVEEKAVEDMISPDRQIVGYTQESKKIAEDILQLLPQAPFKKVVPATEAEMIKYFGNVFLATKVIFGNQIYELCQKLNINYDIVRECAAADPRIGPSHLDVLHGGYRGYGGKCLPKDIRALIQSGEAVGLDLPLYRMVEQINNSLLGEQGIEDAEGFSSRE